MLAFLLLNLLRHPLSSDNNAWPLDLGRSMAKQFLVSSESSSVSNLFGSDVVSSKRIVVDYYYLKSHAQFVVLLWLHNKGVPSIIDRF